jgi:hypothetical protein
MLCCGRKNDSAIPLIFNDPAFEERLDFGFKNDSGYLWTRGYIPRQRTYRGREVPNPLTVEIRQGELATD